MAPSIPGSNVSLRLTRTIRQPREKVFQAWTDPKTLTRWFGPSDEYTVVVKALDLRVGGTYTIEMRHSGGNVHRVTGKYIEVERPSKLAFTWAWETNPAAGETLVTLELLSRGKETEMVLTHERFADEATREQHQQGWTGCLGRLEEIL